MKKNGKIVIYILTVIAFIALVVGGVLLVTSGKFKKKREAVNTSTQKYVAYVKINPAVKLDYSQTCTDYNDETTECEEPVVFDYELVNDDAKEIFKDVDLLANNKKLIDVIDLICDKVEQSGIEVKDVDIQSDWSGLNTYLTNAENKKAESSNATTENGNATENPTTTTTKTETPKFSVSVEQKETVNNAIKTDEEAEAKAKAEAEAKAKAEAEAKAKAEAEKKAKAEAAAKEKAAKTIYLKDNVTYNVGGRGYCCDGCISDSLIRTFKNAKGYKVTSSSNDRIDFMYITKLSSPYNESKYKGSGLISKLTDAGAEECGGLGGGDPEPLTKAICNEYNLLCE